MTLFGIGAELPVTFSPELCGSTRFVAAGKPSMAAKNPTSTRITFHLQNNIVTSNSNSQTQDFQNSLEAIEQP